MAESPGLGCSLNVFLSTIARLPSNSVLHSATPPSYDQGMEEKRHLGQTLPFRAVSILSAAWLLVIAFFVDFDFRRFAFKGHALEDRDRVLSIYRVFLAVAGALVTVIRQARRTSGTLLTIKPGTVLALPASMTSAVSDTLK